MFNRCEICGKEKPENMSRRCMACYCPTRTQSNERADTLSRRNAEIVRLALLGWGSREIGRYFELAPSYIRALLRKMHGEEIASARTKILAADRQTAATVRCEPPGRQINGANVNRQLGGIHRAKQALAPVVEGQGATLESEGG